MTHNDGVSKNSSNPLLDDHAVAVARQALEELDDSGVGKHIGVAGMSRNVATHRFAADVPGYRGWEWQAVLACASGSRTVTVNEVALVPADSALQAPDWVPYSDRLRPGDLGPGDIMPPAPNDERLDDGKLSVTGLRQAKQRWRSGNFGPDAQMAHKAQLQCKSCAFFLHFQEPFGVCANEFSADGHVVHQAYGCGAHSGTRVRDEALNQDAQVFDDESPIF